jgi:hypothetical protein
VWEAKVDGRPLRFHLAGINNQNFIMRDEETGSWWQQVSGQAIQGPMKGKRLNAVFWDELSFATWKREQPNGRVLLPDDRVKSKYEAANWEEEYAKFRVVVPKDAAEKLPGRTLMVGLVVNGAAKAYPFDSLQKQQLILDELGGSPLFLIVGEDQKSARAFERKMDGRTLEFFVVTEDANRPAETRKLIDAETGSVWDFQGKAVSGALTGKQLKPIPVLKDYWFDWKIYHPKTAVYLLGAVPKE